MYVFMYVFMCLNFIYVCMYVCMHVCVYVCVYVCMCVCMCVCVYVCMYVIIVINTSISHYCVCVRKQLRARGHITAHISSTKDHHLSRNTDSYTKSLYCWNLSLCSFWWGGESVTDATSTSSHKHKRWIVRKMMKIVSIHWIWIFGWIGLDLFGVHILPILT